MNLSKVSEYFKPDKCRLNIVGCGSVGSALAVMLARCGVTKMTLWDFDTVEAKNVANQAFSGVDIGRPKVEALRDILIGINPDIEKDLKLQPKGWHGEVMSGYIFLAVDSIEIRREIVEKHMRNAYVKAVFDFRTGLTDAQHFAADWSNLEQKKNLLETMQFSHEEAVADTPVSACGVTLGVVTTVLAICTLGVNNYIHFINGQDIKTMVLFDGYTFELDAF